MNQMEFELERLEADKYIIVEKSSKKNVLSLLEEVTEERDYWKDKAMILLMQVRRLTSRMTDEEVKEFAKELEDG